jgi:LmbE family N-acetylglucosaminyl deacetylase
MSGSNVSVNLAFITDGRASHPFHAVVTPAEIATRRRAEAMAASSVLGIDPDRVAFLGAPDGALAQLQEEDIKKILEGIAGLLSRVMPEAILLPCRSDGSSEHDAAFRLVHRALDSTGLRPRIFEYPVWSWWNPVLLLRSMFGYKRIWRVELGSAQAVKARAMALYLSQTIPIPPDITPALPIGFASMFLSKAEFLLEK